MLLKTHRTLKRENCCRLPLLLILTATYYKQQVALLPITDAYRFSTDTNTMN